MWGEHDGFGLGLSFQGLLLMTYRHDRVLKGKGKDREWLCETLERIQKTWAQQGAPCGL